MQSYPISTIHCLNCAKNLEAQLHKLDNGASIHISYDEQLIYLPNDVDMSSVKRILGQEKITLLEDEITRDSLHSHVHHHHDTSSRNIAIVFFMNAIFAVGEFFFGILFNSHAILTDALHDLGDALSIGLAWILEKVSSKEANSEYSFGHRRFSLLGALITSLVLVTGSLFALTQALPRLLNPQPVNYEGMLLLAIAALFMNLFGTWLLMKGSSKNEKVLTLHLLEDVLGWVAILVLSIILRFQPWYFLDPLLSILLALFILYHALPPFIDSAKVFLEAVPQDVDLDKLKKEILNIEGVHGVSHFHFWSIDGQENAATITAYTTVDDIALLETMKEQIRLLLVKQQVTHSTIEIEYDPQKLIT